MENEKFDAPWTPEGAHHRLDLLDVWRETLDRRLEAIERSEERRAEEFAEMRETLKKLDAMSDPMWQMIDSWKKINGAIDVIAAIGNALKWVVMVGGATAAILYWLRTGGK